MPHRKSLLDLLNAYSPQDEEQALVKADIINFVSSNDDCFLRSNLSGHITGSCWLLDPLKQQVLLTHHKKIGAWLQLGGHADGDSDILRVALREAQEESGIDGIVASSPEIFDVDVHAIGPVNDVPAHYHYDIRFVLHAPHTDFLISDESHALAWRWIAELALGKANESLKRMANKWLARSHA